MKIREAIRATLVAAILLIPASSSLAQETPIGDVASEARAQKSAAHHAKKLITDDDIGPDRGPIHDTDDPVTAVREAWRGFLADAGHTCHGEFTNNSGPRWVETSLIEAQGPDRIHMVKHGGTAGDSELISIGNDKYARFGTQPWQRYTDYAPGEIPFARLAEIAYDSGLKLVRRETIEGSLSFLYEDSYHPGGVGIRNTTYDIWIGADDHRIRKAQTLFTETHSVTASRTALGITRYTVTCSYGPVPEIKPPI